MKFIDILFVLSAAATANAILVSDNGNDSVQASSTSSQVSGPTNEPEPGTSRQGQQHLLHRTGPSAPKRIRKRIRKRPSGRPGSSTLDPDHKQPMYQPGQSTSNQDQKQPMDQPGPSAPNQAVVLSEEDQEILDSLNQKLEELEKDEVAKIKKYCEGIAYQFKECGVLEKEGHVHDPNYTPRTIKDSRKDYKEVRKLIVGIKEQLKTFMESRSLKYVESLSDAAQLYGDLNSDSDSDSD
ncbi:hypothetical protein QVD99_000052 [Batrachochytrium dendrobatidis]|nr:hypothetical protein QVD99_000052 [Batrachochytrium dendrobatidis]